jgi:riboflavin biosynthesis pyrimidine reductase
VYVCGLHQVEASLAVVNQRVLLKLPLQLKRAFVASVELECGATVLLSFLSRQMIKLQVASAFHIVMPQIIGCFDLFRFFL